MEDEELVKMFNPTLKRREAILFSLIVVINGLKSRLSKSGSYVGSLKLGGIVDHRIGS